MSAGIFSDLRWNEFLANGSHFLRDLVKPVPKTGGGAVSAQVGGIAALLIFKVCRIEYQKRLG